MTQKTAIIIGAGPAGLTAAYELLKTSDIAPIILEASSMVGGISFQQKRRRRLTLERNLAHARRAFVG
ncbi:MAG: NAD(P)-binding protein [Firmicutes bacterium]|nr:NAD(P)-binding protein [Bacillota bacterium]